ncbi:MAG: polyprenyl synthetase family protein [Bdellovibrionales bacterium]|nr:polyprenyl synthetase family protein [Bdellovibrionales bacterium]
MDWQALFNAALIRELELQVNPSSRLREALLYAARSPGKRLRPRFVRESSLRFGLSDSAMDFCGIAIESVHLFSLIHDDLPALDDDDLRRGLPTLHKKFDEGTALLAGDELLNLAYSFFMKIGGVSSRNLLAGLKYFSKCIGGEGMIGGQMLELELLRSGTTPDLPTLLKIQDLKTGALFRASILIPALLAGEPESSESFRTLESYANSFGFAFQIADDLEDADQDEEESRKNILSLMGRDAAISLAIDGLESMKIATEYSPTAFLLSQLQSKR